MGVVMTRIEFLLATTLAIGHAPAQTKLAIDQVQGLRARLEALEAGAAKQWIAVVAPMDPDRQEVGSTIVSSLRQQGWTAHGGAGHTEILGPIVIYVIREESVAWCLGPRCTPPVDTTRTLGRFMVEDWAGVYVFSKGTGG
jgi:hypothetical protein